MLLRNKHVDINSFEVNVDGNRIETALSY